MDRRQNPKNYIYYSILRVSSSLERSNRSNIVTVYLYPGINMDKKPDKSSF